VITDRGIRNERTLRSIILYKKFVSQEKALRNTRLNRKDRLRRVVNINPRSISRIEQYSLPYKNAKPGWKMMKKYIEQSMVSKAAEWSRRRRAVTYWPNLN
jgi:hypothetical protein